MKHRLLYLPRAADIMGNGDDRMVRQPVQLQYLYCLRELATKKRQGKSRSLVLIGCTDGRLCSELLEYAYVVEVGCPEKDELQDIFREACLEFGGKSCGLTPTIESEMLDVLRGMRRDDVRGVVSLAFAQCEYPLAGRAEHLHKVALEAKRQRIAGVPGLKWLANNDDKIGGLEALQDWIGKRGDAFNYSRAAEACAVPLPKGALVVGLPGCGKTYLAKAVSRLLGGRSTCRVPLLQMDLSSMLSKWYGKAEANFRQAIDMVDAVAPCVLLVDEIDKLFDKGGDDGNSANRRIFALLLDWLQEPKVKPVLVLATANRIQQLPPELKRKCRFDEVFSTGIPTRSECHKIVMIRLQKRRRAFAQSDDSALGRIADAFLDEAARLRRFLTGADIETIIGIALGNLFAALSGDAKRAIQNGSRPEQYSTEVFLRALIAELNATRSFFDNNINDVVAYWLEMSQLNFRNAGGEPLLDKDRDGYDDTSGRFTKLDLPADESRYEDVAEDRSRSAASKRDYDAALKYLLAAKIHREVHVRCEGRRGWSDR